MPLINTTKSILGAISLSFGASMIPSAFAENVNELIETCVQCHGSDGIAKSPAWPNLAGQKEGYLALQLKAFKSGERKNPLMNGLLDNVNEEQISAIAAYYSSQPFVKPAASTQNEAGAHVRANCVSCHGMVGVPVNDIWPALAGQNSEYLYKQLVAYKTGERVHMLMNVIASELSDQQMRDVAEYYQQQPRN